MNVVFMGTPEFACIALEVLVRSHHHVVAVVTPPDRPAGRGRKLTPCQVKLKALSLEVPVFQPENLKDDKFNSEIAALGADVFVIIAFRILPEKLFSIPPKGAINIHASLLPQYRGAAPINHALLNGETETGLTSFFLKRKVDTGDMIAQTKTEIGPNENFTSLAGRLAAMTGPFLLATLDKIEQPEFEPSVQDNSQATPAPKIKTEDCLIDWTAPAAKVHNHIRAYSLTPGAYTCFDGKKLKILASLIVTDSELPPLKPGEMFPHQKKLFVGTGGSPLQLVTLQPEGKSAMDAPSFLNGYRVEAYQQLISE